jgi:hypothetical protein
VVKANIKVVSDSGRVIKIDQEAAPEAGEETEETGV